MVLQSYLDGRRCCRWLDYRCNDRVCPSYERDSRPSSQTSSSWRRSTTCISASNWHSQTQQTRVNVRTVLNGWVLLPKVKVAGTLSQWFRVKKGVRQGCVFSPYLFNILVEMVVKQTLDGFQGVVQIGGRMITNLRYADDIILLATSEAELYRSWWIGGSLRRSQPQIHLTHQRR